MEAHQRLAAFIVRLVAEIDDRVSCQLARINRDRGLIELKATWQGIHWLVQQQPAQSDALVKIIDISESDMISNIQLSANLYQTLVYHRIHEEALCTLGGQPFGLVMLDYYFEFFHNLGSEQQEMVRLMAELGEVSLCPVVFGLGSEWTKDNPSLAFSPDRLERLGGSEEFSTFQSIRRKAVSDFLIVTWPRFTLDWNESEGRSTAPVFLHSGYALLAIVLREYGLYGWFAGMLAWGEGVEGGSVLPGSLSGDHGYKPVAEIRLSEVLESAYADLGILPLSSAWLDGTAGFFSMPVAGALNDESRDQPSLPPLLILCRFAHYLKVMIRDRVGRLDTAAECCNFLQQWLDGYCSHSDISDLSYLAAYPLKWARMQVSESQVPGRYLASLALFPNLPPGLAKAELSIRLQLSSES
ncbi:MAG: type VI secretion system contractile sheath domain-containing protein [Endozoicomonas sp.]